MVSLALSLKKRKGRTGYKGVLDKRVDNVRGSVDPRCGVLFFLGISQRHPQQAESCVISLLSIFHTVFGVKLSQIRRPLFKRQRFPE